MHRLMDCRVKPGNDEREAAFAIAAARPAIARYFSSTKIWMSNLSSGVVTGSV
jgi:hypothetical protein